MSKFLNSALAGAALLALGGAAHAGDAAAGETVFKKCAACHAVGDGAKNKVGPQLNEIVGRVAGSVEGFKYSSAMAEAGAGGLAWDDASLTEYLANPKGYIKGTKMAFAGLKKPEEIENVIAYLATFSSDADSSAAPAEEPKTEMAAAAPAATAQPVVDEAMRSKGKFGLGRLATPEEVAAWDVDVRPDGTGLPVGRGTVAQGEPLYTDNCASCHGDFGEAVDRWPVLAGGQGTLTDDRPVKTIGSYWPYLSTVYDYVRRAMPFGNARSLSDDDVYAITAYLLYLNDIVDDEEFELSNENFLDVEMPNADAFYEDDRAQEAHYANKAEPCMTDCKPGPVEITMRARVLDVTPDSDEEGGGAIE